MSVTLQRRERKIAYLEVGRGVGSSHILPAQQSIPDRGRGSFCAGRAALTLSVVAAWLPQPAALIRSTRLLQAENAWKCYQPTAVSYAPLGAAIPSSSARAIAWGRFLTPSF